MPLAKSNGLEIFHETFPRKGRSTKRKKTVQDLILIMGIGAQGLFWPDEFCEQLAGDDLRVIRFDHRDIGRSTKLNQLGVPNIRRLLLRRALGLKVEAPYTLSDMGDDVFGLMDALKIPRAHIVGLSMGGMVAQTMAIDRPERLETLTSIMSTTGDRRYGFSKPRALRALLSRPARTREQAMHRTAELFRVIGSPGFDFDEERVRDAAGRAFDSGHNPSGAARHLAAILSSGGRGRALRSVQVPTLVMHGLEDPLVLPSSGIATARAIPNARIKLFPGLGHDLPRGIWPEWIESIREHITRDKRLRK